MPPRRSERSPSTTPVPSTEAAAKSDGMHLPEAQWKAMSQTLNAIYDFRTSDGWDPSKLFHKKVNKRVIPEYYETIKEPVALSTIKAKIHSKLYGSFSEFVRDFALIPHNAQVFNRPDSGAFQDALVIKEQLEAHLQKLVADGLISQEVATLPDLGEIPTYEDVPMEDAEAEVEPEEEEESDDEGEEDEDEDEDEEGGKRKKRGRPRGSTNTKRDAAEEGGEAGKRARGRPPKLLTPMESRILAILKGMRKPKNQRGQLMIKSFDRLPDKQQMPEYYAEVKTPVAYDMLKKKVKRKKYKTVEEFMADVNLMFNNAKQYNKDDSQIYKEAVALQVESGKLYDAEKAKPDDLFADEDGKIPLPNGILHNGELYKVGDWVHIQNPNDLTKPIPAQVYRTYRAQGGGNMVNVCWYYRPEQTVHRFDKHFLSNEVVKTGRYRDHNIEEVEGKCFIMFTTRYFKGRPRGLPQGMEIYVCEARYNETQHAFNKIKTWASCQPDEVRDKDYEMDLFDRPRSMKKHPSPIAYLLKDEQKESDELPKVQWGADGAPPKIGAVHKRPRGEKDSPPPEPTPPPPPKMPTPPPRPPVQARRSFQSPALGAQQPSRAPSTITRPTSYTASHPSGYAPSPGAQRPPPVQPHTYTPQTPQTQLAQPPRTVAPASNHQQSSSIPPNPSSTAARSSTSYRDPPPIEVYILPDQANLSIPLEIREEYQRDAFGRILFFTAPPVATLAASADASRFSGHSVRYLAEKARRKGSLKQKREFFAEKQEENARAAKKACLRTTEQERRDLEATKHRALAALETQMERSVAAELSDVERGYLSAAQEQALEQRMLIHSNEHKRQVTRTVKLEVDRFADDWDTRLA
nr:chromatin structure-remodeling complex subunit rsc1 [Quercus suber]